MKPDLQAIKKRCDFMVDMRKRLSGAGEQPDGFDVYAIDVPILLDYIEKLEAVVKCVTEYKEKCVVVECAPKHCLKCDLNCTSKCEGHNQCRNCVSTCLDDALARLEGDSNA